MSVASDSRKIVFLTGATGNMGKEAFRRLSAKSDEIYVRALIRREEQDHPIVRQISRSVAAEVVVGDLTDAASLEKGVRGAGVVLHVGGLVSPLADHMPPNIVTAVNVIGTRNVVDAIHRVADPEHTRLVYIGTVAQTGSRNAPIHWGRTGDPVKISTYDHYAVTKTQAEAIVAQSGIRHWVSLRQSAMAHNEMLRIFDPIMFHNPINGVFEWSTANDSGRLMAAVCGEAVPPEFWRCFYNIGGGAASRMVNHEFMALSMPGYKRMLRPHWFATRNFHGQWYADSDRLETLVPFREQSIEGYLSDAPTHMPAIARLIPKLLPSVVRSRIEGLARAPGGSLHWFETNDEPHIRAYFGSRERWKAIPRDWDRFDFKQPSRSAMLLSHGYDETRAPSDWRIADLQDAARFRGGQCHADLCSGPDIPVEWSCASNHRFIMTPNLMLRGGHWCPECMIDPAVYDYIADRSPFFRQVWNEPTGEADA